MERISIVRDPQVQNETQAFQLLLHEMEKAGVIKSWGMERDLDDCREEAPPGKAWTWNEECIKRTPITYFVEIN
jgi:hypothetical protein